MFRLILISAALFCTEANAKNEKMALQKAIDKGLVKTKAQSLGAYQDYCMNLYVKNLSPDSLTVFVEAGRRFNSLNEKDQDILIVKEEIIVLKKNEDRWVPVKGFCCQASNHCPQKNAPYDVSSLADSNLVMLARYLNVTKFESDAIQQAVWAISDKKPTAMVTGKNDSGIVALRHLVAGLKGEPIPWYTVVSTTYIFTTGRMETFPLQLKGRLDYNSDRECYTTMRILDSSGVEVAQVIKQWSRPGKQELNLDIPIKGLAKGKYHIEVRSDEKELVRREFEI